MKCISFNVNGLRAIVGKNFEEDFKQLDADFFCLQETKMQAGQLDLQFDGYYSYFNYAERKGYSGTAIYTKHEPLNVTYGIGIDEHDTEGRVITLEYDKFFFITVYTPNSGSELKRLEYRMSWEEDFKNYLLELNKTKGVVVCGDLNVAHTEIDLKNPKYKDELIMADPAISGTNYAVVYNLLQSMGEEAGWAYLESIKGNIPFYAQRGSEPTAKVKNAEMAVGIIPLGGDTYKMEKEFKVKNVIPSDGLPWVPAGMAIFKEAENKDAAKAFVDWALSKEGQEFLKTVAPRMMVRKDVTPPEELKGMTVDKLMKMDIAGMGTRREEIFSRTRSETKRI